MAYLHRVILALLVGLLGGNALAQGTCTEYRIFFAGLWGAWSPSPEAACSAVISTINGAYTTGSYSNGHIVGGVCRGTWTPNGGSGTVYDIGAPSSQVGPCAPSTCTGPVNAIDPADGVCKLQAEIICKALAGKSAGGYDYPNENVSDGGKVGCEVDYGPYSTVPGGLNIPNPAMGGRGCFLVDFQREIAFQKDGAWQTYGNHKFGAGPNGSYSCVAAGTQQATANPGTTTYADPAAPKCPDGQPGTVNGVEVCIPFSGHTPTETKGSASSTVTASDGSKTVTTVTNTTICGGDKSCTTTTNTTVTTFNGSGTQTGSDTTLTATTQGKGEFCLKNPADKACSGETPGSFGGACSGGTASTTCTGDAVMCAIAKATTELKCVFQQEPSEVDVYEAAKAATSVGIGSETTAITSANFDSTNALGTSASCIADQSVTVMGKSISIPFSTVCPHLAMLGTLLLGISWLMAFSIVGRSFT